MSHSFNVSSYFSCVSMGIHSKGHRTWPAAHSLTGEPVPRHSQLTYNGPTVHVISVNAPFIRTDLRFPLFAIVDDSTFRFDAYLIICVSWASASNVNHCSSSILRPPRTLIGAPNYCFL